MYTIALVVPNRQYLKEMSKKLNLENANEISDEQLFTNKTLEKAVLDELSAYGKKSMSYNSYTFNQSFLIFYLYI